MIQNFIFVFLWLCVEKSMEPSKRDYKMFNRRQNTNQQTAKWNWLIAEVFPVGSCTWYIDKLRTQPLLQHFHCSQSSMSVMDLRRSLRIVWKHYLFLVLTRTLHECRKALLERQQTFFCFECCTLLLVQEAKIASISAIYCTECRSISK